MRENYESKCKFRSDGDGGTLEILSFELFLFFSFILVNFPVEYFQGKKEMR